MAPTSALSAGDVRERRLTVIAATSVVVLIASILVAVVVGELPEAAWLFVVPVGMLGGGVTALVSTSLLVASRRSTT